MAVSLPASRHAGPPGAAPAVQLVHVDAWYGAAQALRDVSLDVQPRTVTALIGPSGCGKTTLLRSVNRLNDLVPGYRLTGTLNVHGEDAYGRLTPVEDLRRNVGMLFQRPAPLPMNIFDDVAYGPRLHRLAPSRAVLSEIVEQSLRRAALWNEVKDRLHHPGRSLSGGQQQRLCLARALAVNPRLLLMDEPCAALDPVATAKIEELIVELAREVTVVIVTHNLQQARRIADYTAVMLPADDGGGALVEYADTTAIFERPQDPRAAGYIAGRFG